MINSKKEQLLKEIIQLIDSIKEHADDISGELHIPSLELQTICAKINKLHDKTIILSYLEEQVEEKLEQLPFENLKGNLTDIEVLPLDLPQSVLIKEEKVQNVTDIKPEEIQMEVKEDVVEKPAVMEDKLVEKIIPKPIVPNKPPINDLKTAITINTRLQFINNLFKGNGDAFNNAIQLLNSSVNYEEAVNELAKMKEEYRWPGDSELYLLLKELVQRRHQK